MQHGSKSEIPAEAPVASHKNEVQYYRQTHYNIVNHQSASAAVHRLADHLPQKSGYVLYFDRRRHQTDVPDPLHFV